ncbi:MAG TPA: HPr(Ser) kinase/phosphatase [Spirochaetota bacterium]|nr:HPr(Ser) kinase/phosphatase [Spirochaetota bacterium]HPF05365.1 HPr(Ser) kinase/phosphatase [Spirochaetota bacterium]HPJ41794.1 HPr(Ser) kinase/phosphatase [Spirochaetota bacterium]HPR38106.1 HPr(Ser) kinase/phosphatase [Spirochaetota bacterium]HRX46966.1 HPr(Ser) kinase/phosphatase [Spirochaetota bacterium]
MRKLTVRHFIEGEGRIDLQLRLIAGEGGLEKEIKYGEINRPGLALAGFFDYFAYDRIQIFGQGETAFMNQLSYEQKMKTYSDFFSYDLLCCIFTHEYVPDKLFLEFAEKKNVPVFLSKRGTTRFITLFVHVIDEIFAEQVTLHATLVDVFGVGVLLTGKSGVGKSETALELIERGHRLVADDMVIVKKIDESLLMGAGSEILKHHIEIRGIGIVNVREIFGIRSVRNRKRIEMVILLEEWDSGKEYDRLGLDDKKYNILDIEVPYITVPVRPGRNIPVIIETAALNQRLKKIGINSARELDEKIKKWIITEGQK